MSRKGSRVLRGLALGIIAIGLLIGLGERRAAAQTYDFTFDYDSGYFTGTFVTQALGNGNYEVTGITGATLNGNSSLTYYVVSSNAVYDHPDNTIYNGDSLSNSGGVDFNTSASPTDAQQFNLIDGGSYYALVNGENDVKFAPLDFGPATPGATPAPVPGAGWLSYIMLFLAAIGFRGRRIFALARTFVGGFSTAIVARRRKNSFQKPEYLLGLKFCRS
jgi:hypothetical protein